MKNNYITKKASISCINNKDFITNLYQGFHNLTKNYYLKNNCHFTPLSRVALNLLIFLINSHLNTLTVSKHLIIAKHQLPCNEIPLSALSIILSFPLKGNVNLEKCSILKLNRYRREEYGSS